MREELQPALAVARTLPSEELPRLLGDLEELFATAMARLIAAAANEAPVPDDDTA
jgi:hypothetical protein